MTLPPEQPRARKLDLASSRWWRRPSLWLVVVAVAHAVSPLVLMGLHWWFGIDETVYLSQINRHVPAAIFSAPRARGTTLIAAPVTLVTSNVAAVRIWVTALSGVGLFLAFRPWLKLRDGMVVPLAALLFSSVWTVIYYGFEVMPNEWVAFGVLAATGYLLRYLAEGRRRHLVPIVLSMTAIALLRPSDAIFCGLALIVACFVVRAPHPLRLTAGVAVVAGALLGSAEWVIEAYTSFGGLLSRVHVAQAEQGGGGLHFAGAAQYRAAAGPILCRANCHSKTNVVYQLWWYAVVVLIVVAFVEARRRRNVALTAVPVLVAAVMAAQYVFTVTYAAPRFLIPTYALLSVPCASALLFIVAQVRSRPPRVALRLILAAAVVGNVAIQVHVITAKIRPATQSYATELAAAADQLRDVGIRRPCVVLGNGGWNAPTAYALGCTNVDTGPAGIKDIVADGGTVVWLSTKGPAITPGVEWRRVLVRYSTKVKKYVYLSAPVLRTAPIRTIR